MRQPRFPAVMVVLVVIVVWLACPATTAQGGAAKPVDDPEAYAVYASLLSAEPSVRAARPKTIVFQQETGTNWKCMPSGRPIEAEWKVVVDRLRAENSGTRQVRGGFQLGIPYVVVPAAEIMASFLEVPNDPTLGWTGFYERYPDSGGYWVASAVGFDPERKRAMVYLAHSCGALCGSETHHLIEKVQGVWRAVRLAGVSNCVVSA